MVEPRKNRSLFFVTINTNKVESETLNRIHLKEAYENFYKDLGPRFIKFLPNSPGTTYEEKLQYIEHISSQSSISIGPKFHRLHIHALISITHRSRIHLDRDEIKDFFNTQLEVSVYPNIKAVDDKSFHFEEYLKINGFI